MGPTDGFARRKRFSQGSRHAPDQTAVDAQFLSRPRDLTDEVAMRTIPDQPCLTDEPGALTFISTFLIRA